MNSHDPYEELASMFLTREPVDERRRPSGPTFELLLVGHLPVRAALWLAPVAERIARERGLTALVRLDGDDPLVQLFGGTSDPMRAESCRNLRETILFLGRTVRTWLLRPSARTAMSDVAALRPDRLTLLSGADEVALVSAYRIIRDLFESAEAISAPLPALDVIVIGSDEATSADMVARLARTVDATLGLPVSARFVLPRIEPGGRTTGLRSFAGQMRPDVSEVSAWIEFARSRFHVDEIGEPLPAPPESTARPSMAPPSDPIHAPPAEGRVTHTPTPTPTPTPTGSGRLEPVRSGDRADAPDRDGLHARTTADLLGEAAQVRRAPFQPGREPAAAPPAARGDLEARLPARPHEPDDAGRPVPLSTYVAGLTALPVRSPGRERVELAIDARGHVHLLADANDLRDVLVVEAWVRSHRAVLQLACREFTFDPAGRARCHLFTGDPLSVADLHGSRWALHLLARVEVEGKIGWCYRALAPAASG
ncbi:MAG: hypothetical protein KF817_02225 [Phycisphaeraceae bacterium]|nr:hypothetical protein [Phycisphaeraceae bacterium]